MNPNTHNIVAFGLTCWPGRAATASVYEISQGHPALSIYLDPISVLVTIPPTGHGHLEMARFCRQLTRSAGQLATALDPRGT